MSWNMAQSVSPEQRNMSSTSLTEGMRRFTLKSRKSSYTTSSKSGSSATNESLSNSSRPSLGDSERRRPSLASFSSRLKRSKKLKIEEVEAQPPAQRNPCKTLGEEFLDLPAEIQTSILAYLSTTELLSLRITSKQCHAIFQANATTITRNTFHATTSHSASFLLDLYPSTFSSTTTDAYFLRTLRRSSVIKAQLNVLLTFIQTRVYMLKLSTHLDVQHFAPYRSGLFTRLFKPVGYIQHLLESIRHIVVHIHPSHSNPQITIDSCPSCTYLLHSLIASYPNDAMVDIHPLLTLTLQHLRAATRSPSNVTIFERKLRGWGYAPPPESHISQLVLLGGIPELRKIDEMQGSYGKRLSILKSFSDTVAETVRINSIAFPDFYQTGYDPVLGSSATAAEAGKGKQHSSPILISIPKQIRRDRNAALKTAIEAHASEVQIPVRKSLDVRLDLLTAGMLASLPEQLDTFLVGPASLLVTRIIEEGLVDHERELLSPYGWVQRVMVESYRPEMAGVRGDEGGDRDGIDSDSNDEGSVDG